GNDSVGEFSLYALNTCTVVMSNLVINASANENRPPFETKEGTGCTLLFEEGNTLYGARNYPAIYVCPNSSLTIGECGGTLTATGGYNAPAIGGKTENTSATGILNIRGGTIVATGGEYAAGIGGGKSGSFGTIAISGGEVTATGGEYGAGIGGGNFGSFTGVTISGGTVVATGGNRAAGIGGGRDGDGGNIKISGGAVTAKAVNYAAGIGAGDSPNSGSSSAISVDITGGIVTASSQKASGIGAADYVTCGAVRITGGTIHARTANDSACAIGSSANSAASSVTITGGAIYSDKDDISPAATNAASKAVFPVDLAVGEAERKVTSLTLYGALSSYSYGTNDMWTDASGNLRVWLPATDGKGFVAKVTMESGNEYMFSFVIGDDGTPTVAGFLAVNGDIVASDADHSGSAWRYVKSTGVLTLTANAEVQGLSTNGDFRIAVPSDSGASAVTFKNLTLAAAAKDASTVKFERDVTLTLSGSNVVSAAGQYSAGIEVASTATLKVKGLNVESSGNLQPSNLQPSTLVARGGKNAAGIGSAGGIAKPGKIRIESGAVTATGGDEAAGIGGGVSSNLTADNIVISGGFVTATGGAGAAGIGAGKGKLTIPDGAVKISGGTVLATHGGGIGQGGDIVQSANNSVSVTGVNYARAIEITGGSVHGANDAYAPNPVDADGTVLRYVLVTNLTAGAEADIVSPDIPSGYGMDDVVADGTGSICLWLPSANVVRVLSVNGAYFNAGGTTNNVFDAASGESNPPDSRKEGSATAWRITLPRLEAGATVAITGLEPRASSVTADASGDAFVYLPDGNWAFDADGWPWAAAVSGAPAVAHRVTGVRVNGDDAGTLRGEGWNYDLANAVLSLSSEGPYVLDGTNVKGKVRVRVLADAAVAISNLCLKATASRATPFAVASNVAARVWFTGTNTLQSGKYCAALEVPDVSNLEIGGDGWLNAQGGTADNYWGCPAIGASDGMYATHGITITGGNIFAFSGALDTVSGIDAPVVAGGNIYTGRHSGYGKHVLAVSGATTPQGDWAGCVEVPDLEPGAPVEFTGLPDYYNASNIVATSEGRVYLYLKATYDGETTHFTANGQRYKAVVLDSSAANIAEKVEYAAPDALRIDAIEVAEDVVTLVVSAEPEGWMATMGETMQVLAVGDLALLDDPETRPLGGDACTIVVNADGTATITVPHGGKNALFFAVRHEVPH
ncbi:MAG: hypothetical protein IJV65_06185, partial [Kiritimatiellae bacterium]|nr:hypothetical protein [Kiritimatiellia bacterium]